MNDEYREGTLTGKIVLVLAIDVIMWQYTGIEFFKVSEPTKSYIISLQVLTVIFYLAFFYGVLVVLRAMKKEKEWPPTILPVPFRTKVTQLSERALKLNCVLWRLLFLLFGAFVGYGAWVIASALSHA